MKTKITNIDEIIEYYKENSLDSTCKHFHISSGRLKKIFESNNIVIRSKGEGVSLQRAKFINEVKARITKEMLYEDYIVNNMRYEDVAKKYNISEWRLDGLIREYDLHKETSKRGEILSEYYKNNPDAMSQKIDKMQATKLANYGSEKAYKEHLSHKSKEFWNGLTDEKKQEIFDKTKNTCIQKYGVTAPCQLPQCINGLRANGGETKPNLKFEELLKENNISYEKEFVLGKYRYDFKVGNILIEINPTITHNVYFSPFGHHVDKFYHRDKTRCATDNGYRCIHVWDWDNIDAYINMLIPRNSIYARKCEIRNVDNQLAKTFCELYHVQGFAKSEINVGLFYNDELLSLMTFGKPRYNKNYNWELVRYCASCNVTGGAQKLFRWFKNNFEGSIISYCDLSKFVGETYYKLGFELKNVSFNKHWYNPDTKQHITDNLLRQRGFDQLFGTEYGKGTDNEQLMIEHGFLPVWDCGQATFVTT